MTTPPTITTIPPAPLRNSPSFADDTATFLVAMPTLGTELNALGTWMDGAATQVAADAVSTAADAVSTAADAATVSADKDIVVAVTTELTGVDGHATATLTAAQVTSSIINNIGQTAAADLQLPAAAVGMNFLLIAGEATAFAWRIRAAATDKFYQSGTGEVGADNGYYGIAAPTVGAYLSVFSFQTGASTYDWMVVVGNGIWEAA